MNEFEVKRFGLISAINAEIEGMKVANSERDLPSEAPAYTQADFNYQAELIREIVYKAPENL